jgi:hypothetical protein
MEVIIIDGKEYHKEEGTLIFHGGHLFKLARPFNDFPKNEVPRPAPLPTRIRKFKPCCDCKARGICEELCRINERYVCQDCVERDPRFCLLFGPVLAALQEEAVSNWLTWPEILPVNRGPLKGPTCLTPDEFKVYSYTYTEGRGYKQAARALGIPVKKIRTLTNAARRKLTRHYDLPKRKGDWTRVFFDKLVKKSNSNHSY